MKSAFTAEEIMEACFPFDLEVDTVADDDTEFPSSLIAQSGDLTFTILLNGEGPFYESMSLSAIKTTDDNPFEIAHQWNLDFHWSTAMALTEPDGTIATNANGDFGVSQHRRVPFFGGISDEALRTEIGFFVYEMNLFFGLEDEADERDSGDRKAMDISRTRLAIADELARQSPQTARQLAETLGIHKSQINATLYSSPDLFTRHQASPPIWSLA
jgi:hypothetical protein